MTETELNMNLKHRELEIETQKLVKELLFKRAEVALYVLRLANCNSADNESWKDTGQCNEELTEAAQKVLLEFLS